MAVNKMYLEADRGEGGDECLTPRYGVLPIVKYLKQKKYKKIWCPFDLEDSMYVRVLKSEGFSVKHTHLFNGQDFFKFKSCGCDAIVSNVPFSKKDAVLKKLYELDVPFAVLLPQNSLQSIKRVKLFMQHGMEYLGFDRRICFYTNGVLTHWPKSNHFASGYFCKDVLPEKLIFEKLNPIQEAYYDWKGDV